MCPPRIPSLGNGPSPIISASSGLPAPTTKNCKPEQRHTGTEEVGAESSMMLPCTVQDLWASGFPSAKWGLYASLSFLRVQWDIVLESFNTELLFNHGYHTLRLVVLGTILSSSKEGKAKVDSFYWGDSIHRIINGTWEEHPTIRMTS